MFKALTSSSSTEFRLTCSILVWSIRGSFLLRFCSVHSRFIQLERLMESEATENSQNALPNSNAVDQNHDSSVPEISNHDAIELQPEIPAEEVRGTLESIAATGKFWHNWDKLKSMLSFQLKQVLSEYPEAKMSSEEQISSLGETFMELVKRLDDALKCFIEGPPFTLQRLCEILLAAKSIYPNLSKLALALEKNLFVTSMLTVSSHPHAPSSQPRLTTVEKDEEKARPQSMPLENGVEPVAGDRDEIMTEVEDATVNDDMTIDMETIEEIVRSSETNSSAPDGSETNSSAPDGS